jgi:ACS family tartrate transporter-like MFS transporter
MVLIGSHSDKTRERSLHIFVPCLLSSFAMLGFAWFEGRSAFGGLLCITLATIGPRAILGPFWTLPPMFLTGTALAGAIAVINSVGNLGGIIGPTLFGKMKDMTGSSKPGIVMLAAAILLTGVLGLCVRKDVVATHTPDGSPP